MRLASPLFLALCLAWGSSAAADLPPEVTQALQALTDRVNKLEARNAELETALASDRLSQVEPELATRIKAVEGDVGRLKPAARLAETLDGVSVGGGLSMVAQHASRAAAGESKHALSWRGDVEISLPGGEIGDMSGQFFAHLRVGQGTGVASAGGAPANATAFDLGGTGANAHAILAQAWYQLNVPTGDDTRAEITFGKIDPYGFFDGNAAADDETGKFLNLNFVHNPLLDAGGGAQFDDYGFTPGMRLAWISEADAPLTWGISYGLFATGDGAAFSNSLRNPFHIVQLEATRKFFGGLEGHYRFYAWNTQRGARHDGSDEVQRGWGLSIDQRIGDGMTLWGRYGHAAQGAPLFGRALTLGAEFSGSYWHRAADSLGLAIGHKTAANDYRASLANPASQEQTLELYYNWQATPSLVISPDFQLVRTPGANRDNASERIVGVRASLSF